LFCTSFLSRHGTALAHRWKSCFPPANIREWIPRRIEAAPECSWKEGKEKDFSSTQQLLVALARRPDLQQVFRKEKRGDANRVCKQAPTLVLFDPAKTGRWSLTECCCSAIPGAPS
jgi:hypothetical protein